METFNPTKCDCPFDCVATTLTISNSKEQLDLTNLDCKKLAKQNDKTDFVFCDLCSKVLKHYKIRLYFDQILRNNFNLNDFCRDQVYKAFLLFNWCRYILWLLKICDFRCLEHIFNIVISISDSNNLSNIEALDFLALIRIRGFVNLCQAICFYVTQSVSM